MLPIKHCFQPVIAFTCHSLYVSVPQGTKKLPCVQNLQQCRGHGRHARYVNDCLGVGAGDRVLLSTLLLSCFRLASGLQRWDAGQAEAALASHPHTQGARWDAGAIEKGLVVAALHALLAIRATRVAVVAAVVATNEHLLTCALVDAVALLAVTGRAALKASTLMQVGGIATLGASPVGAGEAMVNVACRGTGSLLAKLAEVAFSTCDKRCWAAVNAPALVQELTLRAEYTLGKVGRTRVAAVTTLGAGGRRWAELADSVEATNALSDVVLGANFDTCAKVQVVLVLARHACCHFIVASVTVGD